MPEGCARDEWKVASGEESNAIPGFCLRMSGGRTLIQSTCNLSGIWHIPCHSSLVPHPWRSKLLGPGFLHSIEFIGELIEPVQFDGFANVSHQVLIIVQIMNRVQSRS